MLHLAHGETNPEGSPSAGTAVPCRGQLRCRWLFVARAAAWGFFVRGAGQVPPPRLPTDPGSEQPPRSKSAAFAYSEQVGAHMPKMHQTKLATIIIIKCAVVLGEGRAWQTSPIIMKLSMCAAVLQQLCLAQQAGNDACYKHPPSIAHPPAGSSLPRGLRRPQPSPSRRWEGSTRPARGCGQTPSQWVQPFASWFCGLVAAVAWASPTEPPPALPVPQAPSCALLLQQNLRFPPGLNPRCPRRLQKPSSPSPVSACLLLPSMESDTNPSHKGALVLQLH